MRKRIIISFILLFTLFSIGGVVTVHNLLKTTSELRHLIGMHEIEDIRQDLSYSIQKVKTFTYASADVFAENIDSIVFYASRVDETVAKCHDCHHEPHVRKEIEKTEELNKEYQQKLSYLITTLTEGKRRQALQDEVADLSHVILSQVRMMVDSAAATLTKRTEQAMHDIDHSYLLLGSTFVITFLTAVFIARYLMQSLTRPIDEMLTATGKITAGELGYTTAFQAGNEFDQLLNTFNEMSVSLARNEDKIEKSLARLDQLNRLTLPLHSTQNMSFIKDYLRTCITELIDIEYNGIMFKDENGRAYTLEISTSGQKADTVSIKIDREEAHEVFQACNEQPIIHNRADDPWPFKEKPATISTNNLLIHWLVAEKKLLGVLIAINKKGGDFQDEDLNILGILANNITVALENVRLYRDLQIQMEELRKTQRQLVEAEKLTALGTLAGGVAHDFNNILCGMIGYVALVKRNTPAGDRNFQMLETIEKAGFRAANLTKQLLTFARQEIVALQPMDINEHVTTVTELLRNTVSKLITIRTELDVNIPAVNGDSSQLETVIMNLYVNARDAMPDGGEIIVSTSRVALDKQFCLDYPEAKPGEYVILSVTDHGSGINEEILPRIFEPFFTTKEFGKGTGLGLAMVYGIVKSHNGFCLVSSEPDKGTTFSIYLPVTSEKLRAKQEVVENGHLGKSTILVVDDESIIAEMLTEYLREIGCKIIIATNGEEAIEKLAGHRDEIDLVILDINMPVMDGKEAFLKMREIKPDLKVLVATGYAVDGKTKEVMERGAQGYIQKPYNPDNLSVKIKQILGG